MTIRNKLHVGSVGLVGLLTAFSQLAAGATADFNKDGYSDILWHNPATGAIGVWYMKYDYSTQKVTRSDYSNFDASLNELGSTGWQIYGAADFNGDGYSDILWHNPATGASTVWFMQQGNRLGSSDLDPSLNILGSTQWQMVGASDFDHDGYPDIFWHNPGTGQSAVWFMQYDSSTQKVVRRSYYDFDASLSVPGNSGWQASAVGDFNGDSWADILWHNPSTGEISVWLMIYDGTKLIRYYASDLDSSLNELGSTGWQIVGANDFNGDGYSDILWHNAASGATSVWFMRYDYSAWRATRLGYTDLDASLNITGSTGWKVANTAYVRPATADFNQDGFPDILWHNGTTGVTRVWYMQQDNRLGTQDLGATLNEYDSDGWQVAGVGDFNQDNFPDIFWHNGKTGASAIWYMQGINRLSYTDMTADSLKVLDSSGWRAVGVADFNLDGFPDIVWHNGTSGVTRVWYMQGANLLSYADFDASLNKTDASNWKLVAASDFNLDGFPDVLWYNGKTGSSAVWYMQGTNRVSYTDFDATLTVPDPADWTVTGSADFNLDGFPDILWRDGTSGGTSIWYMQGGNRLSTVDLNASWNLKDSAGWRMFGEGASWTCNGIPVTLSATCWYSSNKCDLHTVQANFVCSNDPNATLSTLYGGYPECVYFDPNDPNVQIQGAPCCTPGLLDSDVFRCQ